MLVIPYVHAHMPCQVINLARIYVSVKRVFLDRSSYARTSASETPLYHQNNVVAYPQDPDGALRAVGLFPLALAKTVMVQFVGGRREQLRQEPELFVSVPKLRDAFRWLLANCWPFIEGTKFHEVAEEGSLSLPLEELLAAYQVSACCPAGGVPAELVIGASPVDPKHGQSMHRGQPIAMRRRKRASLTRILAAMAIRMNLLSVIPVHLWMVAPTASHQSLFGAQSLRNTN